MTRKGQTIAAIKERMPTPAKEPFLLKARRQLYCVMSWPFFRHAYDAIFVERPDKRYGYYEHCAICGRARSWIAINTNHRKPGAKLIGPMGSYHVNERGQKVWDR